MAKLLKHWLFIQRWLLVALLVLTRPLRVAQVWQASSKEWGFIRCWRLVAFCEKKAFSPWLWPDREA